MAFTVDNFKNPYSGIPRTGFLIQTADSTGGLIDYNSAMTLTVSTMTTLNTILVDHTDGITTVNEISVFSFYFQLYVPVDASCRLKITFPSDMPLTANVVGVSGADMFATTTSYYTNSVAN